MSDTGLKVDNPALRARATYPLASARALALRTVPGATIRSSELEEEHGKLIYSFDMKLPNKPGIEEVNVDATNGALIGHEHEDARAEHAEEQGEHAHRPARTHHTARPAPPAPAHP
jgi:hypothetical protein